MMGFKDGISCYNYYDIDYDCNLMMLKTSLKYDKRIQNASLPKGKSNITKERLIKELVFFDNLGIKLRDINTLKDNEVLKIHPKDLDVTLGRYNEDGVSKSHCKSLLKLIEEKHINYYINIFIRNTFTDDFTKFAYIHEITHTQLSHVTNIDDALHTEVLPTYMDILYSYKKYGKKYLYNHLLYLYNCLDKLENNEKDFRSKINIKSTIVAINLVYLYFSSSDEIKKEINNYIQNVFDCSILLEDMLRHFEVDYLNCNFGLRRLKLVDIKKR